jgi:hypothetical protein
MTLVGPQPAAWLAHLCSAGVERRAPAHVPDCDESARNDEARPQYSVPVGELGVWPIDASSDRLKRGCGHCPHPGVQIRLYRRRTGPDWGGFRKRGGFSG